MATGRDASDVALTTSFGRADLCRFFVVTEEEKQRLVPGDAQVIETNELAQMGR
jgi:hypothetical protein